MTLVAVKNGTESKACVCAIACVNTDCPAGGVGEVITTVCAGEGTAIIAGLLEKYMDASENFDYTLRMASGKGSDLGIVPETSLTDTVDADAGRNTGV